MIPLEGISIDCIALVNQDSPLYVAITLVLNPGLCVSDHCDMAEQLEPLIPVFLVEANKGLDDVGLFELGELLGEISKAGLRLGYVQILFLLRS